MNLDAELELPTAPPEGTPLVLVDDIPRALYRRLIAAPLSCPGLHGSEKLPRHEARRMTPRRLSRRIAMFKAACVLARLADLVSMRVGVPRGDSYQLPDGSFQRYVNAPGQEGEHGLAALAGVTLSRLRRALGELRRMGWITSSQRVVEYTNAAGARAYYACRVVYVLTPKFFEALGIDRKVAKERKRASDRCGERRRIYAGALLSRGARGAAHTFDAAANDARRMGELELKIRQRYPAWSRDRVRAEARRRL